MAKTIIARHKVGDINVWIKGHHDRVELFAPAASSFKTFQDTDDPNSVVMIIEVTDLDKLAAIMNDPKNKDVKNKHTVIEPIIMSMPVDL
jgi:hypothetical protein